MTKSYNIATFIYCVLDNFEAVHCNFPPSRLITQFFFMCTSAYNVIFFLPTDTRQLRTGNLLDVSPVVFSVFTGKYTIHNVHMLVNIITLLDFYGVQCYSLSGFWLFVGAGFPPHTARAADDSVRIQECCARLTARHLVLCVQSPAADDFIQHFGHFQ